MVQPNTGQCPKCQDMTMNKTNILPLCGAYIVCVCVGGGAADNKYTVHQMVLTYFGE